MTDVIKLAKERRAQLAAEVAKLDSFLRTARALAESDADSLSGDIDTLEFDDDAAPDDELVLTDMVREDDIEFAAHIGKMIRHRRWMMGMTHEDLAALTDLDVGDIHDFESGVRPVGSEALRTIAIAMKVPVAFFLQETGEAAPPPEMLFEELLTEV